MSKQNGAHLQKPDKPKRKLPLVVTILLVILALFVVVTAAAYGVFHYLYSKMNTDARLDEAQVQENIAAFREEEANKEPEESDLPSASQEEVESLQAKIQESMGSGEKLEDARVWNILLIGTDARDLSEKARSDSIILLSLNQKDKTITLTSFMRDIYTYIPGAGFYNRLNVPNAIGGPEMLVDTLEGMMNIGIDNYVSVNFYSFVEIVDALGGVDIEVTKAEIEEINLSCQEINYNLGRPLNSDKLSSGDAGLCHLNGNQALGYARIRHIGGDMQRTERQRTVLMALAQKAKSASASELMDMVNVLLPMVTTDLSEAECLSLAMKAPDYLGYQMQSLRIPEEGAYFLNMVDGMSVVQMEFDKAQEVLKKTVYGDIE